MGNPEIARSGKTDIDPDHVETGLQGQKPPRTGGETGPVPADNQPGHHPPKEQDKPDLDAFAARLGTDPDAPGATSARKGPRPKPGSTKPAKATPAKSAPATSAPAKSAPATSAPAKSAPATSAPATSAPATSAPAKATPEPARRPATVLAPSAEESARISAPQPEPEQPAESPLTTLMLLPLRQTVKGLEQLNRTLTDRLERKRR